MLTIYAIPESLYCAKLRIVLRQKTIAFEQLPPPGGYGSDEYRAIVPSGNLPAMIHDGFLLADSEAIAEYLEEAFPDAPMMPDTVQLRAKAREFSRFHDTRLEPAVRSIFPQVAYASRDTSAVQIAGAAISKHLTSLAQLLASNPLDTNQLWLCDCGFAITFAWIRSFQEAIDLPVVWPQIVTDYEARLKGFDVVKTEFTTYQRAIDAYLTKARRP
jgi:glutathione S-transferase/maleylpyruvate isomerase